MPPDPEFFSRVGALPVFGDGYDHDLIGLPPIHCDAGPAFSSRIFDPLADPVDIAAGSRFRIEVSSERAVGIVSWLFAITFLV